jgi:lipopolysaccharide transport system permease protein
MSSVITNFVTLLLSFPVIAVFAYMGGGRPDVTLLALIPVCLLTLLFAHVFGLLLSVLYVFFRDVKHLIGIMMQIMFFATPVVYEASMVPERLRFILYLNPMAALIPAYRDILLKNVWPDWNALAMATVITLFTGILAYNVFAQYNRAIPEYV